MQVRLALASQVDALMSILFDDMSLAVRAC